MTKHGSWRLVARPSKATWRECFRYEERSLPSPSEGQARVRTLLCSVDPTHRIWISDVDQYLPPIEVGEVVRGAALGVVEESHVAGVAPGTLVSGFWGWQTHVLLGARELRHTVTAEPGVPLSAHLGVLGGTGLTAYFGIEDVARPMEGETVVVTAAAGAVGSIAAQLAKRRGAYVVGVAGGPEKCAWLVESCGLDAAIDRHAEDLVEGLSRCCPRGVDVGFENVGGPALDAVLAHANVGARIAICGLIADYPSIEGASGPRLFRNVLMKRLTLQGFIVLDYARRFGEATAALGALVRAGELVYRDHVVEGLERAPEVLSWLFDGRNEGKLMIQVGEL